MSSSWEAQKGGLHFGGENWCPGRFPKEAACLRPLEGCEGGHQVWGGEEDGVVFSAEGTVSAKLKCLESTLGRCRTAVSKAGNESGAREGGQALACCRHHAGC